MKRISPIPPLLLVFILLVAACGGGSTAGDDTTTAPPTTTSDDHMDDEGHGEFAFGEPADAADADRVISIIARDDFTFTPASISIAVGETVTFRVLNEGAIAHDFTLGDEHVQDEHEAEMAAAGGVMDMHDEPNVFSIAPGETKETTWHFTEAADLLIGCHVPGHYAAGMKATVTVGG